MNTPYTSSLFAFIDMPFPARTALVHWGQSIIHPLLFARHLQRAEPGQDVEFTPAPSRQDFSQSHPVMARLPSQVHLGLGSLPVIGNGVDQEGLWVFLIPIRSLLPLTFILEAASCLTMALGICSHSHSSGQFPLPSTYPGCRPAPYIVPATSFLP